MYMRLVKLQRYFDTCNRFFSSQYEDEGLVYGFVSIMVVHPIVNAFHQNESRMLDGI